MTLPRLRLTGVRSARAGPFDVDLDQGETLAITGPSGAGKSLLLRMIADLDPHDGDMFLDGQACSSMSAAEWRQQVVYCPAESGWWHDRVGAHFAAVPNAAALGLRPKIFDQAVATCSSGERQRLALLRALDLDPPVLLLDEPTGALDAATTERVEALLRHRLAHGMTLIIVTHDERQAERLAYRRARMEAGRMTVIDR